MANMAHIIWGHFWKYAGVPLKGTHEPIAFSYRRRDDEENDAEANDAQGSNAREQSYF